MPDQTPYPALSHPKYRGVAVVRLYACPVKIIGWLAVHPWFVIKKKDSNNTVRWEVVSYRSGSYGHVRDDIPFEYNDSISSFGGAHVLHEVTGKRAEILGAKITRYSPHYPCRDRYRYVPGPNSNTYAQWVLFMIGWKVQLPPHAYGALMYRNCLLPKPYPWQTKGGAANL